MQTFNKIIALSGQFSAAFTRFTGKILRIFAKRKPGWKKWFIMKRENN
ncbi:Hypothetical protein LDBND_0781 [Lactobacillus delbrueckii subsp. bulgaricus ND02]|nr:Hypothetical protein LDBND_0781 [Lactobacillus delbrueckii subsp. bulgaricus ND02]